MARNAFHHIVWMCLISPPESHRIRMECMRWLTKAKVLPHGTTTQHEYEEREKKHSNSVSPFYHFESRLITAATHTRSHTHIHNALFACATWILHEEWKNFLLLCTVLLVCLVFAKRPWLIIADESNVHKSRIDRLLGHHFFSSIYRFYGCKSTYFRRSIICHRLESKRLKWIDAPRRFECSRSNSFFFVSIYWKH